MITRNSLDVIYKPVDTTRLPDSLIEGASLLVQLRDEGALQEVAQHLQIRRQGGFCGLDIWLLLFLYMSHGTSFGVRKFWAVLRAHSGTVAALAGRQTLPSPASLSRALAVVDADLLRAQATWLLTGLCDVDGLLKHPAVQSYDAQGNGWHVFDLDPTVTTLRHRSLPKGEDLPEAHRRSEHTAVPGHSGRKRGDVQHRRVSVSHAGSAVHVHCHLSTGNGKGVIDLERGLDSIVETCERLEHPRERVLVRLDGEYGNVPSYAAFRERRLPFITRVNRPRLFEDPTVLKRLRAATWHHVPDSGAGPQRSAADLGLLTIKPGRDTRRPDGSTYEPITIRVVASIFPKQGKAKRGRTLDGWQVELFAADVDASSWPAPEVVAAYFARNGTQENGFAQEDRELGLDRIVSYHLPGQELAALVGLSLWNLRIVRGFELSPPPSRRPKQCLRHPPKDTRIPASWPRDPKVVSLLDALDWDRLLESREGWIYEQGTGELRCEAQRPLSLCTVASSEASEGQTRIIFVRPLHGCSECEPREHCLRSPKARTAKHVGLLAPTETAKKLHHRLALVRGKATGKNPAVLAPLDDKAGVRHVAHSLFLPARARQRHAEVFRRATLHLDVKRPPRMPSRPVLVALDVADRQRRRGTWTQNVERNALPRGTRVSLEVAGGTELREMLGQVQLAKQAG